GAGRGAEILQRPHVRSEPVRRTLCPGCLRVRVVGAAQHGDENLRGASLTGMPVRDRCSLAGVVDEQLVAGQMILAQRHLLGRKPAPVLIAEDAVLPALRMSRLVLLPQQQTCDAATS